MKKVYISLVVVLMLLLCVSCKEHVHNFIDGKCSCGEEDIINVPPTVEEPKEIDLDMELLRKKLPNPSWSTPLSNFVGILKTGSTSINSVPIIKCSGIDSEYIGIYVNKTFMDTIRMELSAERKQLFLTNDSSINWNLHSLLKDFDQSGYLYDNYQEDVLTYKLLEVYFLVMDNVNKFDYYDLNNKKITKEDYALKYYEISKYGKIDQVVEDLELLAVYGTRKLTIVNDLHVKENIGKTETMYFWLPTSIISNKVVVNETLNDGIDSWGYNSRIRLMSTEVEYIYTSTTHKFEDGLYVDSVLNCNLGIVAKVDNVKYLVLPEFGNINKDGKDVVSDKEKELSTLINKEYSKLATLELFFESYLKEDVSEEEKNKLLDEYIVENGYVFEVYKYSDIIE